MATEQQTPIAAQDRRRADEAPRGEADDDRRRLQGARRTSSRTSRSRRSATSRIRSCSRRSARRAATGSTRQGDVARLRTILRLQRDEFLPLRVIRQELAAGPLGGRGRRRAPAADDARDPRRAAASSVAEPARRLYSLDDVLEETRADPKLVAGAAGLRRDRGPAARRHRTGTTTPSARSSAPSSSSPATASAGATCASSAPRPTARPRCCSRSSPRRCARATPSAAREAVEALENLAAVTTHLKHLLLVRDLRKLVA